MQKENKVSICGSFVLQKGDSLSIKSMFKIGELQKKRNFEHILLIYPQKR